jgi:hypothetical protein
LSNTSFFQSSLETTNPSGASCLLRCLIYKVHTAHQRRAFILPHFLALVKYFF